MLVADESPASKRPERPMDDAACQRTRLAAKRRELDARFTRPFLNDARVGLVSKLIQKSGVFAGDRGFPREGCVQRGIERPPQQRENLVPQSIARDLPVLVRTVLAVR
jgi:hypothetical protein